MLFPLLLSIIFAADTLQLTIVHTNDLDNTFYPQKARWINPDFPPILGGEQSFKELLAKERQDGDVFLLLNGGGMLGGNLIGQYTDFRWTEEFMNTTRYDATTLGVKDFLHGVDTLKQFLKRLKVPVVCANITYASDTLKPVDWVKPYIIIHRNGLKIGIFGLITEYMPIYSRKKNIKGLFFLREIPTAKRVVAELKKQNVDMIIALAHISYNHEKELLKEVPDIDIVIGGLDRGGTRYPTENPVNHNIDVRTYGRLSSVGILKLKYSRKYRTILNYSWHSETLFADKYPVPLDKVKTY